MAHKKHCNSDQRPAAAPAALAYQADNRKDLGFKEEVCQLFFVVLLPSLYDPL